MKNVLFLALTLISFKTYSAIWDPHEKVIMSILRRAERTPEAELNRKYSSIEQFSFDHGYFELQKEYGEEVSQSLIGITKYMKNRQLNSPNYLFE